MAGLFDFLGQNPAFGAEAQPDPQSLPSVQHAAPMADPGALTHLATEAPKPPGFLDKLRQPDENGINFSDRLYAFGAALSDTPEAGMAHLDRRRAAFKDDAKLAEQKADRARKNAAFRSAYKDGKFDPGAYTAALGDSGDPSDIAELSKTFAPKTGVDGGFGYSIGPDGNPVWGAQRPQSFTEQAAALREAEIERHNQAMEEAMQRNLGIRDFTAHRPRASGRGGVPPPPPGAGLVRIVK